MSNNQSPSDGVIRYQLEFTQSPEPSSATTANLRAWFRICRQTGLVGQDPGLYDGVAYGNLSQRTNGERFLITGTQTSGLSVLQSRHFCWVIESVPAENRLVASGPCQPSSEAMTHGMIYQMLPQVNAVFHAHSPVIWRHAARLGLPVTAQDAEYGTPEMTEEVERLVSQPAMSQSGVFSMGGHQDGIVAYGENPQQAGILMISTLAAALAQSED